MSNLRDELVSQIVAEGIQEPSVFSTNFVSDEPRSESPIRGTSFHNVHIDEAVPNTTWHREGDELNVTMSYDTESSRLRMDDGTGHGSRDSEVRRWSDASGYNESRFPGTPADTRKDIENTNKYMNKYWELIRERRREG